MTGIVVAIIVGLVIAMIEKSMTKGARGQGKKPDARATEVRMPRTREAYRQPSAPPPTPQSAPDSSPFLHGEGENLRTTETAPIEIARPVFTKSQQELRRTIILGEILRRKF